MIVFDKPGQRCFILADSPWTEENRLQILRCSNEQYQLLCWWLFENWGTRWNERTNINWCKCEKNSKR